MTNALLSFAALAFDLPNVGDPRDEDEELEELADLEREDDNRRDGDREREADGDLLTDLSLENFDRVLGLEIDRDLDFDFDLAHGDLEREFERDLDELPDLLDQVLFRILPPRRKSRSLLQLTCSIYLPYKHFYVLAHLLAYTRGGLALSTCRSFE